MKKLLALLLALTLMLPFVALAEDGYEIALVTDVGNIDDKSFNQAAWEGVVAYATENNITYNYYRPAADSTDDRIDAINLAIEKGAKIVVCPGYLFEDAIFAVQSDNPDVLFLLLDGEPHSADYATYLTTENTHNILYQEEQAGFFAGYAAVKDGYTKLGFLGGMAVPAVIRFGYGFVQGADLAAKEMGITVDAKYWYSGVFSPNDEIKTKMSGWFTEGVEVVFACGGGIYLSAVAAAEEAGAKIIGVDKDQYFESDLIITSAMKDLTTSVKIALSDIYANDGKWSEAYAGKTAVLGAADKCVGLPTAETSWRLEKYTVAEYEELFAKVVSGEVVVSNAVDAAPAVTNVTVDYQE